MMKLKEALEEVKERYLSEINLIREFANTTERSLTRKQKKIKLNPKTDSDLKELDELISLLQSFVQQNSKKKTIALNIDSEYIKKSIIQFLIPLKHKSFLTEMTLSYLIAYQEAFIKDYLYQIFINYKSLLKSGTKASYEEILNYKSIKSLISYLANKEIEAIGYGSIDDIALYFHSKFNINLLNFKKWKDISESNYRRNLIIHNKGITNDIYCKKTGYKEKGVHIETNIDYVLKTATILSLLQNTSEILFKNK